MQPHCLLVADDLTGACDAAVHFARRGLRTRAWWDLDHAVDEAAVLAFSTGSREMDAGAARSRLTAVAAHLAATGPGVFFQKIDSLLRGHPGSDITLAKEAFGCARLVATPAYPALGRTVRGGVLRVEGLGVAVKVAERIGEPVADVETDADLDRLVEENIGRPGRTLWAGSGGLAAALARRVGRSPGNGTHEPCGRPVLFVIGSDHPITLEQERLLLTTRSALMTESAGIVAAALEDGRHVILRVARKGPVLESLAAAKGLAGALFLSGGHTAALVCRQLGAESIALDDEILPGVPRGTLLGGLFDGTPIATKAGAFGAPDALVRIVDYWT